MIDLRSAARQPRLADMALVVLGRLVTHQLEGVLPLDHGHALGDQALQFDGLYLAAVLFALRAFLGLLVVVQLPADPVGCAVEEVDRRPEEIVKVGFEARVLEGADQGVEDVGDGARDPVAVWQWPLVGLIGEGSVAVELEFIEDMVGG